MPIRTQLFPSLVSEQWETDSQYVLAAQVSFWPRAKNLAQVWGFCNIEDTPDSPADATTATIRAFPAVTIGPGTNSYSPAQVELGRNLAAPQPWHPQPVTTNLLGRLLTCQDSPWIRKCVHGTWRQLASGSLSPEGPGCSTGRGQACWPQAPASSCLSVSPALKVQPECLGSAPHSALGSVLWHLILMPRPSVSPPGKQG